MDAAKIGQRIQQTRKARGMTQSQLAAKVDISTKYMSNIECGDKVPKFETFVAIANALEVDANTLLVDVLTVSSVIISSEITEKLMKLSPFEQRKVKRLVDVIIEDAAGGHKRYSTIQSLCMRLGKSVVGLPLFCFPMLLHKMLSYSTGFAKSFISTPL